jgi:disulfide bond formation protein DsbB
VTSPLPLRALTARLLRPRTALLATALFSTACMVAALLMQYVGGYAPCVMCVEQRMAYVAGALVAVGGLVFARTPKALVATLLAATAAYGWGLTVAARQVWLQAFPPPSSGCVMAQSLADEIGLARVLPQLFAADGDCLAETAKILGLTMPQASLLAFCALIGVLLASLLVARRRVTVAAASTLPGVGSSRESRA